MDWDKIRIFYTVAEAGSFTRAGDDLGLSQSAVSRQISALERELKAPLFHRHARGLILTEQGDLLFRAARDMRMRLETDARPPRRDERAALRRPQGHHDRRPRLHLAVAAHRRVPRPLSRHHASSSCSPTRSSTSPCARPTWRIRLRRPAQPDLIQRRLFTVHFHIYASTDYIKRFGEPKTLEDLDDHRILSFGGDQPSYLLAMHYLSTAGRDGREPRPYHGVVNNITALKLRSRPGPASPCCRTTWPTARPS